MESITIPSKKVLKLAVIGHTNTGKTSLMRTLLHDSNFGNIADSPGTTRHVERARLPLTDKAQIELSDTPGLEDSMDLLDYLEQLTLQSKQRLDGPESIERFLNSPESQQRFEQEGRVLKELLKCDAGLYVVDIREPVLTKYKDELSILARCGKPVIPILNFVHSQNNYLNEWKAMFSRIACHVSIEFDTVAPAINGEIQLYQKLALVLDQYTELLNAAAQEVETAALKRQNNAYHLLVELLIDAVSYRCQSKSDDASANKVWQQMQDKVRAAEHSFIEQLLNLYKFKDSDYTNDYLPIENGRWGMDLFHPQAIVDMGIDLGKGFVAGAAAGAAIDVFTAGLSLGAAALIGGVVGGIWQGAEKIGTRLWGHIQGYRELTIQDEIILVLAARGLSLIQALEHRGHAAQQPIKLHFKNSLLHPNREFPEVLNGARSQPQWSRLTDNYSNNMRRDEALRRLSKILQDTAAQ